MKTFTSLLIGYCIATILALLALAALTAPAGAQTLRNCAPRDMIIERLKSQYGETRRAIGLGANSAIMELHASDETGTWTITVTMANGISCLVASGDTFETISEVLEPEGDKL